MTLPPFVKALCVSLLLHGAGTACWWQFSPAMTHTFKAGSGEQPVTLYVVDAPESRLAVQDLGIKDTQVVVPLAAIQSPATPPSLPPPRESAPVRISSAPSLPQLEVLEQTHTQATAVAVGTAMVGAEMTLPVESAVGVAASGDGQDPSAGGLDAGPALDSHSLTGAGVGMASGSFPGYLLKRPPDYPEQARKHGWQGMVLLEVSINPRGEPSAIKVKEGSGFTILDEAAVKAVKQWRFEPARVNGRPQSCAVEVPIRFSLSR
jgi:periplasmic protein TonB